MRVDRTPNGIDRVRTSVGIRREDRDDRRSEGRRDDDRRDDDLQTVGRRGDFRVSDLDEGDTVPIVPRQ